MAHYQYGNNATNYKIGKYEFNSIGVCLNPDYLLNYEHPQKKCKLQIYYCFNGEYYDVDFKYNINFGSCHGASGPACDISNRGDSWYKYHDIEDYKDLKKLIQVQVDIIKRYIERDKIENESQWQENYFEPFFTEFFKPKQLTLF